MPIHIDNNVWGAIITAVLVIGQIMTAYFTYKTRTVLAVTNHAVHEIAHSVNSMKDELVASTDRAATAEGHAAGVADEKARAIVETATDSAKATGHAEGRAEANAEHDTNAAARAHNAARDKEKP